MGNPPFDYVSIHFDSIFFRNGHLSGAFPSARPVLPSPAATWSKCRTTHTWNMCRSTTRSSKDVETLMSIDFGIEVYDIYNIHMYQYNHIYIHIDIHIDYLFIYAFYMISIIFLPVLSNCLPPRTAGSLARRSPCRPGCGPLAGTSSTQPASHAPQHGMP